MLDGRNAYNAHQPHGHPVRRVREHRLEPAVAGHTTAPGHGGAGGLLRKGPTGPLVEVDAGVRQGMVLGPVLFSIGTIATLRQLESSFSNASFTAYLDDVTVAAPPGMLGKVCEATSRGPGGGTPPQGNQSHGAPEAKQEVPPIGAECVWAKAISLMAVDAVMPALKTCFKNLQYGVGNNIELAIQKIRRDFHLKGSVAMLDGRNAYNAISRTAILSAVYGNTAWSPLWRVTRLLLGTEGLVGFYEKGQLVHSWKSTRGVRQGMVLGPVLFSIGTIATLRQLESSFSNASFTAYLDDVTVAAPPGMLGKVCEATSRAMRALGIETNEDKTEVLNKGGPVDMPAEYIRPFARVLGAGVANDPESELITQFVQRKAEETDRLFRAMWSCHLRSTRSGGSCRCRRCHA
ncbi:SLACS reverse transcriptase [Trypanosoma cruzi]|uniref:SLACS reverse transcriptase n=1 Tax=Trypanosoma cruzi TaxID=5693 RepID=A0A2V2UKV7_TRYCR|nr:SLACS reverse transcriptase [Trypanosoma cruzi]